MTEQRIGFCTTSDGVRIAYATIGSGSPRVWAPGWVSHLALDWEDPDHRADIEYWAARNTIVRYDKRGTGLSERKMEDYSIEARVLDLEAVVDDLRLKKFALTGISEGGPVAIAYAARHPECVSRLILMGTFAHGAGEGRGEAIDAFAQLVEAEWGLGSQTVANLFLPSANADQLQRFARYERDSASRHDAAAMIRALKDIDVSALLPKITAPTLVVHGRKDAVIPFALGCELASKIPNAQLFAFEGGHGGDAKAALQLRDALEEFLSGGRTIKRNVTAGVMPEDSPAPGATMIVGKAAPQSFASGRYAVVRPLGAGGQKSVYLVHDNALDRDCALALIRNEDLGPDDLLRFQREAQAMARLGAHSNIVSVFDIGEQDGRPFLVSEYIAGGDLRQLLLKRGRLPLAEALAVGSDIARALAVAHARGVVHRDVKPLNIWLTEDGAAKLGDFGLAFSLDASRLTMPGTVMGTAAYLSPEQALGEPVTERSDLYALGCLLYEMVCGRPPFADANATAVIAQHLNAAPAAPSSHEPDIPPALEELILRLLAKSPAQRPESASAVLEELRRVGDNATALTSTTASPAARPGAEDADAGAFVGRGAELERLEAALERTIGGAGSLVMLVGEPGIGKTRLLDRAAAIARTRGMHVLSGRCYDGDWAPPFSPFVEAIKQHAVTAPPQRLRADLGADAGVLARIVPALRERLPAIEEPPQIPAEGERYRLLEATSSFFERVATHAPVVLMLDDLHWADKGTIAMLQQVARTSATQRVLVLGAYRDVELDRTHPLADALAGLRREKHFERIALRGLDGAEVAELLDAIAEQDVPAPLSEAIARETDGNPFFIKEVLLHLVEERKIVQEDGTLTAKLSIAEMGIPEGVREVIGRRLSRVSDTCGRMLTVASALTAGFSWDVISAIALTPRHSETPSGPSPTRGEGSSIDDAALLDAVDEALGAQLIVERERGRYDFTHALIRHTLYEELSTPRRVLLHRQIGEALERLYATDIEPHLAELAHHYYQASPGGDATKAAEYAKRAGDQARAMAAWDEAIAHTTNALQLMETHSAGGRERCKLMLSLGEIQSYGSAYADAATTYLRAAQLARELGAAQLLATAALGYAGHPWVSVGTDPLPLLHEAAEALQDDSVLRARVLSCLAVALPWGDPRKRELNEAAEATARRSDDKAALGQILTDRLFVTQGPDFEPSHRVELANEVIRLAQLCNGGALLANGRGWRMFGLLALGDLVAFDRELAQLEALAEQLRMPWYWQGTYGINAMRAIVAGQYETGEELARRALIVAQGVQEEVFTQQIFVLRMDQGRLREIEPIVRAGSERFPGNPINHCVLPFIYAELGEETLARSGFERVAAAGFGDVPRDGQWFIMMTLLSATCAFLSDAERARILYDMLRPYAHLCATGGAVVYAGSLSSSLGLLATTMRRYDDAERHFEDALAMNSRMGARPWVARTQHDYARMLRKRDAAGDAARARTLLNAALATAREIGMAKVAADCDQLLSAS